MTFWEIMLTYKRRLILAALVYVTNMDISKKFNRIKTIAG